MWSVIGRGSTDGLLPDALEPVLLHLLDDPVERALETLRPGHPVAESIREQREPLVRGAVGQRRLEQRRRRGAVGLDVELRSSGNGNREQQSGQHPQHRRAITRAQGVPWRALASFGHLEKALLSRW
jgi:hypothetical protein